MRVRVRKWGNRLALRIPKPFAEEAEVREGAVVDVSVEDGKLVAVPTAAGKFTLKRLLRGVSKKNLYTEVAWGHPEGREVW